jgi:hypothetical protein
MKFPRTKTSVPEDSPVTAFNAVAARARELRLLDETLLSRQLALENAGITPKVTVTSSAAQRAARLLDGSADGVGRSPSADPANELYDIVEHRQALSIALQELATRELTLRREAGAAMRKKHAATWTALTRRRALAVVELQRANAACRAHSDAISAISGGYSGLQLDIRTGPTFGAPVVGSDTVTFLRACVRAGIVTEQEISL